MALPDGVPEAYKAFPLHGRLPDNQIRSSLRKINPGAPASRQQFCRRGGGAPGRLFMWPMAWRLPSALMIKTRFLQKRIGSAADIFIERLW
jgi:hypothetical protein